MIASSQGPVAGVPAWVHGRVVDVSGAAIAGAELDVWQNGADMLYTVQRPEAPEDHLSGRYPTREDGSYALLAVHRITPCRACRKTRHHGGRSISLIALARPSSGVQRAVP